VPAGAALTNWSFGGGTVLMRRHRHRFSKDIDIFLTDPQWLGYLTPRLSEAAAAMTANYVEAAASLKLVFEEGEIDFVASAPLTSNPWSDEIIQGRIVHVETSGEIIAKKVWHRGDHFTARDIFDLAMVLELDKGSLDKIQPVLKERSSVILARIEGASVQLREDFDSLDVLDYRRTFDECVRMVRRALT
jgi:predicted nucleotidyltransferase component of viral defense system